jgi:hypothetical protein
VVRVPDYRSRDPGFDSRRYQIFRDVVLLERGPLSLVRITEELLEWKSSGSGIRKSSLTAIGIRCADHARDTLHPQNSSLTSLTWGGSSVDIVCLQTKATEFGLVYVSMFWRYLLMELQLFQFRYIHQQMKANQAKRNQTKTKNNKKHFANILLYLKIVRRLQYQFWISFRCNFKLRLK